MTEFPDRHPCVHPGCEHSVQFDDEPWCYGHSPDEGSSVRGYSWRSTQPWGPAAPWRPASPATEPPTVGRVEADDFRSECLRLAAQIDDKAAAPVLNDLRDRLMRAQIALIEMAAINHRSGSRLSGKAQGVSLAISYVDEYLRGAHVLEEDD